MDKKFESINIAISNKTWDVFISHASEDKEDFVRPLAKDLQKHGVRVWYDEFELKVGNSLIDSINKGMQESNYGIIVCSPSFFEKNWTDYEFKSLLTQQINYRRCILPIWHNVDVDFIRKKSPYLLDIKALSTNMEWNLLVDSILEIVRPDIINSHLMLKMGEELYKKSKDLPIEQIPISQIQDSPIRHKSMPVHLIIATQLISEIFGDVIQMDYKKMVVGFAKDLNYEREFVLWSAMASTYVAFIRTIEQDKEKSEKKVEIFTLLFNYVNNGEMLEAEELKFITEPQYYTLIKLFIDNYNSMMEMITKYS